MSHLVPLVAVILAAALMQLASGVLVTLLPLRLGLAGAGEIETGLIGTGYAAGFMLGCLLAPRVIRQVGHIRAFAAFAGTNAATALLFQATLEPQIWILLRVLTGVGMAGLSTVADSWINARTPNAVRGRVLSIYTVTITLAASTSQLFLLVAEPLAPGIVMIIGGLFSLALIPVSLTRAPSPPVPEIVTINPLQLYASAPVALVGGFLIGLMNQAILNMTPFLLAGLAVPTATIALLIGSAQAGKVVLQWPLGLISDRVDRRYVIAGGALTVALLLGLCLLLFKPGAPYLHDSGWTTGKLLRFGLFGLWGGVSMSLFAICIAHANDRTPQGHSVATASTLLFAWASGSALGPLLGGLAMRFAGGPGLFIFACGVALLLGCYALWRIPRRRAVPASERGEFAGLPQTSPVIAELEAEMGAAAQSAAKVADPTPEQR